MVASGRLGHRASVRQHRRSTHVLTDRKDSPWRVDS